MDLKGKLALFPRGKTTIDIVDMATGEVVQQHDVEGTLNYGASVQRNIAAVSVSRPQPGVNVMDLVSGKMLCKFALPNGREAQVILSKDALTLVVGTVSGMFT